MEAEKQQKARRLVKVRKRKIVSDHSSVTVPVNKENTPPEVKKSRTELDTRLPSCVEDAVVDWGLKTKARFVSSQSFDWANVKRAKQESQGLVSFTQGHTDTQEPVCELQSLLHYWEHPSLPSLSLFAEERHRVAAANTPLRDTAFTDSLKEDWSTSFRSLFQLFRLSMCSHFYLCASDLTILFVTSDPGELQAVISPSTSGFRRALNREGVEFCMPLDTSRSVTERALENESDDECSNWIDSVIGTEKKAVIKTTVQRQSIDSRPESTLLVPTSSLQSLFNYLLNCKTLISTTGALARVPPTLVSPTAFQGATLRTLKVMVGSISESGLNKKHYVDVVGPLLPHTMRQLRALLDRTQSDLTAVHTVESRHTSAFTNTLSQDS